MIISIIQLQNTVVERGKLPNLRDLLMDVVYVLIFDVDKENMDIL